MLKQEYRNIFKELGHTDEEIKNRLAEIVQEFFYGEQVDFDPVPDIPSSPSLESCPTPETLPIESLLR